LISANLEKNIHGWIPVKGRGTNLNTTRFCEVLRELTVILVDKFGVEMISGVVKIVQKVSDFL
jgi:hypothetical protein